LEVLPITHRDGGINIERSAPWPEANDVSQDDLARGGTCQEVAGVVLVRDCVDPPDYLPQLGALLAIQFDCGASQPPIGSMAGWRHNHSQIA